MKRFVEKSFLFGIVLIMAFSCGGIDPDSGRLMHTSKDSTPEISLSKTHIDLSCITGHYSSDNVKISNSGSGELNWSSSKGIYEWLDVIPGSGKAPEDINITANCTDLEPGSYSTQIYINADGLKPKQIDISLTVIANTSNPILSVAPTGVTMNCQPDGQASKIINITNIGTGLLTWNAVENINWLSLSSTNGAAPSSLTITANCGGLSSGSTHQKDFRIFSSGSPAATVTVSLNVSGGAIPPEISLTPETINKSCSPGQNISDLLSINNSGSGTFLWNLSENIPWLTPETTSGTSPSSVVLNINCTGLSAGNYSGEITVTSSGIASKTVTVNLEVSNGPVINLSDDTLNISCRPGEEKNESFTITNTGGGDLAWYSSTNEPWLSMTPGSGMAPSTVIMAVDCKNLTPGTFQDTISINGGVYVQNADLTIIVTVEEDVTAPPPPASITLTCVGTPMHGRTTIQADWSAVTGAVNYKLYLGDTQDPSTWEMLGETPYLSTDFRDIFTGNDYYIGVKSVNSNGVESNEFTFDTINCSN